MDVNYEETYGLESLGIEPKVEVSTAEEPDIYADLYAEDATQLPATVEVLPAHGSSLLPWPARLPMELALGAEEIDDILLRYEITPERFNTLKHMLPFRRALADAQKQVRDEGLSFKLVCGRMASEFLEDIYVHFFDPRTGITTKHDLLKSVVRYAGLEPEPKAKDASQGAVQVAIQINL